MTSKAETAAEGATSTAGESPAPEMESSAVIEYLRSRGFAKALAAMQAEIGATDGAAQPDAAKAHDPHFGAQTVSMAELASKNVPRDPRDKDAPDTGPSSALEHAGAQALLLDPTDTARGFAMIKTWCCGSLDIYQPELLPLLLPLFVHSYMNLVDMGLGSAAEEFYVAHTSFFQPMHASLLSHLRALCLPSQIQSDELAQRFRTERYVVKMSPNVFGLLIGWLTDGTSPVGFASMDDASLIDNMLEPSRRGREAMLKIINERCRLQVLRHSMFQLNPSELEEGTGLTGVGLTYSSAPSSFSASRFHPSLQSNAVTETDTIADYNARAAGPQLKLHSRIPLADDLKEEVDHILKGEQQQQRAVDTPKNDGTPAPETQRARSESAVPSARNASEEEENEEMGEPDPNADLLGPALVDLPPQPSTFRTVDLLREVERVRDARKCLRIDPSLPIESASVANDAGKQENGWPGVPRTVGLPSVCLYTFYDAEDGMTCSKFSEDLTLMAAGFEESYVQVWSLKGEPLRELESDLNLSTVRDRKSLHKHRVPRAETSRKLVGHSAPVYSVAFDPVGGSGSSPRSLLSCSAEGITRLWSLDTYSALAAYRGHQYPVWDVTWGPLGTYFATASADRTARLWSTERINPLRIYAGHLSDVDCVRFHPNSLYLATGSSDRTCRLWDVQRGACVRLFVGHQSPVSCIRISTDGRYLASASGGNTLGSLAQQLDPSPDAYSISLWDLASGRRIKKMWGHTSTIHEMDFSADSAVLVSGAADETVRCWDVRAAGQEMPAVHDGSALHFDAARASADCVATYFTKNTPVYDVHFSPRNLCLASGVYGPDSGP
ncbi:Transcription initiation factor TFIID subunit 5 [Malassezia vespertilionis]|uniref:Taf5p n=1 Tax=Malassezia vespertilionis TaxID=2020962 RepID=A0A2N1JGB5_9BASI|nr:Transcription initiation factor TFIID subunit 5 [Malassezia vespertilionis]PKI85594.1 Taf5p [Malassezia vespertilionis]WFD04955.1 Transcription initiation factor TFIID subunit 5 [Malassezia vespertilionis]